MIRTLAVLAGGFLGFAAALMVANSSPPDGYRSADADLAREHTTRTNLRSEIETDLKAQPLESAYEAFRDELLEDVVRDPAPTDKVVVKVRDSVDRTSDLYQLQFALARIDCFDGPIDGRWTLAFHERLAHVVLSEEMDLGRLNTVAKVLAALKQTSPDICAGAPGDVASRPAPVELGDVAEASIPLPVRSVRSTREEAAARTSRSDVMESPFDPITERVGDSDQLHSDISAAIGSPSVAAIDPAPRVRDVLEYTLTRESVLPDLIVPNAPVPAGKPDIEIATRAAPNSGGVIEERVEVVPLSTSDVDSTDVETAVSLGIDRSPDLIRSEGEIGGTHTPRELASVGTTVSVERSVASRSDADSSLNAVSGRVPDTFRFVEAPGEAEVTGPAKVPPSDIAAVQDVPLPQIVDRPVERNVAAVHVLPSLSDSVVPSSRSLTDVSGAPANVASPVGASPAQPAVETASITPTKTPAASQGLGIEARNVTDVLATGLVPLPSRRPLDIRSALRKENETAARSRRVPRRQTRPESRRRTARARTATPRPVKVQKKATPKLRQRVTYSDRHE